MSGLLDDPRLRSALEGVRQRNESSLGVELDCDLPRLGKRCLSLSARFVPMPDTGRLILLTVEDVTAARRGEAERAQLLREMQAAKASAEEANRAKDIFLNSGIAHREAGVGQIGAGVTSAPMACFAAAVKALAQEVEDPAEAA